MKIFNSSRFWFLTILILLAILTRLMEHPPNFAPIAAVALFAGAYFSQKKYAILVPLLALFIGDILLEITYAQGLQPSRGFYQLMPVVYGCFALFVIFGRYLRNRVKLVTVLPATLLASIVFFIVTNFAVWTFGGYPMNMGGLIDCYGAAIPFFRYTILGDLFFVTVLFTAYDVVSQRYPQLVREKF
ncbi:MAG: hypothetical protein IIA45_10945 [Bacteroidetes bacterium]|nr:hypothetical protein [Bacteroidota bacterium]